VATSASNIANTHQRRRIGDQVGRVGIQSLRRGHTVLESPAVCAIVNIRVRKLGPVQCSNRTNSEGYQYRLGGFNGKVVNFDSPCKCLERPVAGGLGGRKAENASKVRLRLERSRANSK
jgi:hypothetical protein